MTALLAHESAVGRLLSLRLPPHKPVHHRFVAGCPDCQEYDRIRMARNNRLRAYGLWRPRRVSSIGVVRRLQALAVAGYGLELIARALDRDFRTLSKWRTGQIPRVTPETLALIDRFYQEHWGIEGPERKAAGWAIGRGWQPFEAWTDETIDDPDAQPYNDPAAASYVDEVKLRYARLPKGAPGRVAFVDLSRAEQAVLYAEHFNAGGTLRMFKDRYRPVPIGILRELGGDPAHGQDRAALLSLA